MTVSKTCPSSRRIFICWRSAETSSSTAEICCPFLSVKRWKSDDSRATAPIVSRDLRGLVKVNPIANWSDEDVAGYIADHDLTDDLFLASHMVSLEDKVFLFAGHEAEILLLAQRLARQGVDRFAFIPMQPGEQISLPERAGPVRIVPEGPDLFRLEGRPDP